MALTLRLAAECLRFLSVWGVVGLELPHYLNWVGEDDEVSEGMHVIELISSNFGSFPQKDDQILKEVLDQFHFLRELLAVKEHDHLLNVLEKYIEQLL